MTPAEYLALGAICVSALTSITSILIVASIVRWSSRASARKEELLYQKLADLLDRNMHLTDGGAFASRREPGGTRSILDDDQPTGRYFTDGILLDPENGVPDFAYNLHDQPDPEDLN